MPNHFAKIYSDLYSSVDDKDDLVNLKANLEERIDIKSLDDVNKVTEDTEDAIKKLKVNKAISLFNRLL